MTVAASPFPIHLCMLWLASFNRIEAVSDTFIDVSDCVDNCAKLLRKLRRRTKTFLVVSCELHDEVLVKDTSWLFSSACKDDWSVHWLQSIDEPLPLKHSSYHPLGWSLMIIEILGISRTPLPLKLKWEADTRFVKEWKINHFMSCSFCMCNNLAGSKYGNFSVLCDIATVRHISEWTSIYKIKVYGPSHFGYWSWKEWIHLNIIQPTQFSYFWSRC